MFAYLNVELHCFCQTRHVMSSYRSSSISSRIIFRLHDYIMTRRVEIMKYPITWIKTTLLTIPYFLINNIHEMLSYNLYSCFLIVFTIENIHRKKITEYTINLYLSFFNTWMRYLNFSQKINIMTKQTANWHCYNY